MDIKKIWNSVSPVLIGYGIRVVGALVMWIVGRWAISLSVRIMRKALKSREIDTTLQSYLAAIGSVALNVLLVIAILSQFGVETTSFAALMAAAGLAIGSAWGGLLANFAAGAFLLVLRPFKVGDLIEGAGVKGYVDEIGLFATTITTFECVKTYVGNNKLLSDNVSNFSSSKMRRVERSMQLAHGVDVDDAIVRVLEAVRVLPHVLAEPAPDVFIKEFTPAGPLLAVRPFTLPDNVVEVGALTNRAIRRVAVEAGYPVPVFQQPIIPPS